MKFEDYDKKNDIMFIKFQTQDVKHSRELDNVNIVLDFDKKDNVIGIQIFDFMKVIKISDERMKRILGDIARDGGAE